MNPPARAMLPVITYAASGAGGTTIAGAIHDAPNSSVRVELFSNDAADPSGYGEGQTFLGFTTVLTAADGNATFAFNTSIPILPGRFISATATAADSTTEFSADRPVSRMGDVNQDGSVNFSDLLLLAQHYGQSGPPTAGDLNADGRIDFSDLLLLAQNYGSGTAPPVRLRTSITAVRLSRSRR